jgi:hypothetical protein
MRTIVFLIWILSFGLTSWAQRISGGLSYHYFYSKQLDRSIQLYNFNRPFLENKQSLFTHGASIDAGYLFTNEKGWNHGINCTYSFFGSEGDNTDYLNRFHLHQINLNYVLRFAQESPFFGEVQLGIASSSLFRRVDGEPFLIDDSRSKSLGIGGNIGLKLAYSAVNRNKHHLLPFVYAGFAPYIYAPKNEAVINATQELYTKNYMNALHLRLGLAYELDL